ncbi:MAG: RecX family transcriptional regulator [Erysipelotrichaceae bacterium]|nr:RecX family transcriptional regulator [Erysipelotrichaceae bacterium]
MNYEKLLNKDRYEVKDIKYPIKKYTIRDNYVIVYLEDSRISVSLDDYVKYSISSLKGLDDNLYNILVENEKYLKAYQGCLRKLSVKDNTVKNIRDYLKRFDISDEIKNQIIDELILKGYLDDEKYCKNRIMYLSDTLLSNRQIRYKLLKEGISQEYIDKYLTESSQSDKVLELVRKYNDKIQNKSLADKKRSIRAKLMSMGFSSDDINDAFNQIEISSDNEDDLLNKEFNKIKRKYENKYKDIELKQKITASLMGKGFRYEAIKELLDSEM